MSSHTFQHAFSDTDTAYYGISGQSSGHRPSYTSTHPSRASAFSSLLTPTLALDYQGYAAQPGHSSHRTHDIDSDQNAGPEETGASRPWAPRGSQLPPHSRAFNLFMGGPVPDSVGARHGGFFVPSYLRGTVYAQKLEEQHKARLQALRDGHTMSVAPVSSMASNGKQSGSHRSVSQDGERPPFSDDSPVGVLPSKWNRADKNQHLDLLSDSMEVKFAGQRASNGELETSSVRADHPIPPECGIYYYEITILSRKRDEATIGIGLSSSKPQLSRAPGWENESWAYHGDDGCAFNSQASGKSYGPTFTTGDVIGCGINFHTGCVFFTKNGVHLGIAFREVTSKPLQLFPIVGLKKTGEQVRANFGQTPFIFDIDGMMKAAQDEIWKQIDTAKADNLVPALQETELLQAMVLQFLQHDGYIETARAFADEIFAEKKNLSLSSNEEVRGTSIRDDEDAANRQSIRRAILEGDIDKALKLTNAYYPSVLKENNMVYFKLRCRKFVEMVRRAAEQNLRGQSISLKKSSNGHAAADEHQMELDEDDDTVDDDDATSTDSSSNMDWGGTDANSLVTQTILYGTELRTEFDVGYLGAEKSPDDAFIKKTLDETFSLMAYDNPLKVPEISHLMDRRGRVVVAEELNSAILTSLGKSSKAALETMWVQTEALLEQLRPNGHQGAFVSVQDIVDKIPKSQPF